MKIKRDWVINGGLLGLTVSFCCLFAAYVFHIGFEQWTIIMWPTSILLLLAEALHHWLWVVTIYSITIVLNGIWYALLAAALSALFSMAARSW
jgi:hypothetical protein